MATQQMRSPTPEGVSLAAAKIADLLPKTPLIEAAVNGTPVWFKAESLQPVGAFKIRGAWHRLTDLTAQERARGVVGVSSGNHAQGVAWAAKRLGIEATIVMPVDAPKTKIEATRGYGANVVLYDRPGGENRDAVAQKLIDQSGATLVHAYGDPWVIEGQGTAGLEIAAQLAERGLDGPTRIVCPCGGGGLTTGLTLACPDAEIVPVEPEGWDDVRLSLEKGEIVPVPDPKFPTECDALQTPATWPINFDIIKARIAKGYAVTAAEVRAAQRWAFAHLHLVVEPGGAAALAAVLAGKVPVDGRTAVILSGGNTDADMFAKVLSSND